MKKAFALFFVLLVHLTVNAQTRDYTFRNAAPDEGLTVERNTRSGMQMRHALKQISIATITDNGYTGDIVTGGKGISLPANAGEPSLPAYSNFVAIPNGATAHIEMGYRSMTTIENVDLLPAAPIKADTDDSPNTYEKNPSIYNKNAFFPERPVTVSEPFSLRGVQTVAVTVVPYQYNPVTKELRVYDDLQFDVRFDGGNGEFGDSRLRSPYWDPILMQNLANYNQLPTVDYEARMQQWVNTRTTGCEYLIVIPNNENFRTYANQLRDYRIQQGILTEVKSLSEMGCTTTDQMKSYFHNAYNTWDIPPVAVLLLGDHNTNMSSGIPGEETTHTSILANKRCISDNGYADVDDDLLPDMVFSRLVAASASEAQVMVSKQIEYEYSNPNMNASSYDKPITAVGWQTDRWFQLCCEVIGGYWRQQGKQPVRINDIAEGSYMNVWSANDNTNAVVDYFGPNGLGYIPSLPSELGNWTGGTGDQVVQAINNGAMMVQHRDHGVYEGWSHPTFKINNVSQLTNTGKLTFVSTINCQTGAFDHESGCLVEALMRRTYNGQNAGAVGCIAPTEVSFSFCNDAYAWGMYDHFDPQFMPTFGPFADYEGNWRPAFGNVAGKYFLQQSSWPYNSGDKALSYKILTAHCDAFLTLYTQVPTAMTVTYPAQITATTTNLTLTAPAGAVVALTRDNQILAVATATGSSQNISFAAQPANTTITVVATKQDRLRYVGSISVVNGTSYEITAVANPEEGGIVTGAGNYAANTQCVLNATANDGYDFANWTLDGNTISTEMTYSFNVTVAGTYTANFTQLFPHDIVCAELEHGIVIADKSTAVKYDTVSLQATSFEGYCFSAWDVRDAGNNPISVTDNRFIMPDSEVTVSAVFLPGRAITLSPVGNGNVVSNFNYALPGTIITLTITPDSNHCLTSLTVYKTDEPSVMVYLEDNQFAMPDYDVTVSAIFEVGTVVTLAKTLNGTISADVNCAPAGTIVNLSAIPNPYYELIHGASSSLMI